ncbi:hypothetical protein QZH41_014808 [Actinostola sp. cb2023]|nr:hypothetical protein QZH41_014808 [Actinostola sp. cb2023]
MAEREAVDLDPLTEEGQEDVNDFTSEDWDALKPKDSEVEESWYARAKRFDQSAGKIRNGADREVLAAVKNRWGFELITAPVTLTTANDKQIAAYEEANQQDEGVRDAPQTSQVDQEILNTQISERTGKIEVLSAENEVIEKSMSLKEKVKRAFLKNKGSIVLGALAAAGVVISAIVLSATNAAETTMKTVGNGLKAIGKKLGELLPGEIGAIASFLFRAAGEAIGFLAKNAWLLIVGVVVYLVERVSSRSSEREKK